MCFHSSFISENGLLWPNGVVPYDASILKEESELKPIMFIFPIIIRIVLPNCADKDLYESTMNDIFILNKILKGCIKFRWVSTKPCMNV